MPAERHANPAYETNFGNCDIRFWYNSKTHKYHIVDPMKTEELVMSKAKAEAVIQFLKFIEAKE